MHELLALHPDHVSEYRKTITVRERAKLPTPYLVTASGDRLAIDSPETRRQTQSRMIAVVPLFGVLSMHGNWFTSSTSEFASTIRRLDSSAAVSTIAVWINSPGGTVSGTAEAADALFAIKKRAATRTIAIVEPLMASAASWIGTAAGEVVSTPSGESGSIGVMAAYFDESKLLSDMGVAITVERVPQNKARFSGFEPIDDSMRAKMRDRIERSYQEFVSAMSRNRAVSVQHVRERFGNGEMLDSREAVAAGLCDRISTFDECLADCLSGRRTNGRRAETASAAASAARWRRLRLMEADL